MTYPVRISRRAEWDATNIRNWIAEHSPSGARQWLDAFEQAIKSLEISADHCALAPEADELGIELRELSFHTRRGRPYRLLLIIENGEVLIASVRSGGQDLATWSELDLSPE